MQVVLVVLAPVIVIAFAMAMEHIETLLKHRTDHVGDPQEFIESHTPSDLLTEPAHARVS
ncbi:hypothetical protein [Tomitella cavernea]|uniref:Uncharacterized protein n=1 Tax=Tomitella cavernea TaxID=1387982 RepID=A0ABP9C7X1_9ACTN|nr:hypothetical protein [Tomitella cavernea]